MRKVVLVPLGLGVVAIAGVLLALPSFVAGRLEKKLAERGLEGNVGAVSFAPSGVHIEGLTAKLPLGVGRIDFGSTWIELDWLDLDVRAIRVDSGHAHLRGSKDDVEGALERMRGKPSPASGATKGGRFVSFRKLDVEWSEPFGADSKMSATNVELDHGPGGTKVGSDVVRAVLGEKSVTIIKIILESSDKAAKHSFEKVSVGEVLVRRGETANATPDIEKGEKEAADESPLFPLFAVDGKRPAMLREGLAMLRSSIAPRLPRRLEIERVSIEYAAFDQTLHVGPGALSVERSEESLRATLSPLEGGTGKKLALSVEVALGEAPTKVALVGGPVSFEELGVHEGDFGLVGVKRTALEGDFLVELSSDAESLAGKGTIAIDELGIESPRLAPGIVSVPRLEAGFELGAKTNGEEIRFGDFSISLAEAKFKGDLELLRKKDRFSLEFGLKSPLVACQSLLNSTPNALLGAVHDIALRGTVSLDARVAFDSEHLGRSKVKLDVAGDCEVSSVPASLDPSQFKRPFVREVEGPADAPLSLELGPGTASWAATTELPPNLEKAVLVTEDGRFFRHHGFDPRAIESSIIDNVKAGRFVRGASTISMQLAKNLYLGREKVLSRKLQELILTMVLEQTFSKKELLELYFNVVELGPYVYGVKQAADYYFRSTPQELTTMQAFFLASVLPNPTKNHFDKKGNLFAGHASHLLRLIDIASERKLLSPEEAEAAKKEELVFGRKETRSEAPDPAAITGRAVDISAAAAAAGAAVGAP